MLNTGRLKVLESFQGLLQVDHSHQGNQPSWRALETFNTVVDTSYSDAKIRRQMWDFLFIILLHLFDFLDLRAPSLGCIFLMAEFLLGGGNQCSKAVSDVVDWEQQVLCGVIASCFWPSFWASVCQPAVPTSGLDEADKFTIHDSKVKPTCSSRFFICSNGGIVQEWAVRRWNKCVQGGTVCFSASEQFHPLPYSNLDLKLTYPALLWTKYWLFEFYLGTSLLLV